MLHIEHQAGMTSIALDKPSSRNALDPELMMRLSDALSNIPESSRLILLKGNGPVFCAGADLQWMQESIHLDQHANIKDAHILVHLLKTLSHVEIPVIAQVHGCALGGAIGLLACCDIVIAEEHTKFGLTEVLLGLAPAMISPYVMRKISPSAAHRYFLSAELFSAKDALHMGLIHHAVPQKEVYHTTQKTITQLLRGGPNAIKATKRLLHLLETSDSFAALTDETIAITTSLRTSPEGQEGLRAFLQKRSPSWQQVDGI